MEPTAHVALALALTWLRRFDEAEKSAEHALELDPNFADGFACLAHVRDYKGEYEGAIALYTRAYRLDPQFDMVLHFIGRALLALDRFGEAETAFKRRLTFSPRSDLTRFYLACLYGSTGRHEEARKIWAELLEINPSFSIEHLRTSLPYADPTWLDKIVDGLRQADIAV
jgi:adenylate cyclase